MTAEQKSLEFFLERTLTIATHIREICGVRSDDELRKLQGLWDNLNTPEMATPLQQAFRELIEDFDDFLATFRSSDRERQIEFVDTTQDPLLPVWSVALRVMMYRSATGKAEALARQCGEFIRSWPKLWEVGQE